MTKINEVMRKTIRILAVVLAIVLKINVQPHAQQQPSQVVSVGGGTSAGGNYTQFSVVGGEAIHTSISGGSFTGQVGFLFRNNEIFDPEFSISGNVITPEGSPLQKGTVALLQEENGTKVQVLTTSLNGEGKFSFPDVKKGSYTLKVVPDVSVQDPLPLLSTFLGGTQIPGQANVFLLDKDATFPDFVVLREAPAEQEWRGNSAISGILVEEDKASGQGGRIMSGLHTQAGTPMAGAQVFLTDPATKAIKFTEQTDASGSFSFKNVASREYGFLVEYQGKSFEMAQKIDLSQENSSIEITAVISESGVNATIEQVTAIKGETQEAVHLYPNPVKDRLTIRLEHSAPEPLEMVVLDGQGKVLKMERVRSGGGLLLHEMDFSGLPTGFYLLRLQWQNKVMYRKVVKE